MNFRDTARGLIKNTSILAAQQVITMTSSVILTFFLPRYLGPVEYGSLFLAGSYVMMLQVFVNYGSNYLIAKQVARTPAQTKQILTDSIVLRGIFSFLGYGIMLGIALFGGYSRETTEVILIYGIMLFVAVGTSSLYACFQGRELLTYTSLGAIAERVTIAAVAIFALLQGTSAHVIAIIIVGGQTLNLLVLTGYSRKIVDGLAAVNWKAVFAQAKEGIPYFLFTLFGTIYYRIDTIMLSKMSSEEIVGNYGAAYRLFESLNIPFIVSVALYPVLSRLWKDDADIHRRTVRKSLEYTILLGLPVSFGLIFYAPETIEFFFGLKDYAPAVVLLQVLSAGMLFLYVDMILGTMLIAADRQKQLTLLSSSAIPINIGLNLLAIPYFQTAYGNGAIGAAAATGVTEIIIMLVVFRLLPPGVLRGFRGVVIPKGLLAVGIMALSLLLVGLTGLSWLIRVGIGAVVYGTALIAVGAFEPAEIEFFRGSLPRWFPAWLRGDEKEEIIP
jgi:O-antigen/teichoic acid export membrane protein